MIYYQDKYVTIRRPYGTSSFIRLDWKAETRQLSDSHFKNILKMLVDILDEKSVKKVLANGACNYYVMSVEMQDWHEQEILPRYRQMGIFRIAFLTGTELMAHLSYETLFLTEGQSAYPATRFFASEYEAIRWLLE